MSPVVKTVCLALRNRRPSDVLRARELRRCDLCTTDPQKPKLIEVGNIWNKHIVSKGHKAAVFRASGYGRDFENEEAVRRLRQARRSGTTQEVQLGGNAASSQ